jgi:hypothetical protein
MSMMQPSGPGPFSKRTDRQGAKQLPNAAYGEQKEFQDMQAGAPMAKTPTPQMPQINPMAGIVPLTAPTQRPDEPVTAGVDAGPGPGREILGLKSPTDNQLKDLSKLAKYMPLMAQFADSPESSGTMKAFVKYLRSQAE